VTKAKKAKRTNTVMGLGLVFLPAVGRGRGKEQRISFAIRKDGEIKIKGEEVWERK
jgi:hypothetical protein